MKRFVTFALTVEDLLYNNWLTDFSAIGESCHPRGELQRGHANALAKTCGREIDWAPFLARPHQTPDFTRKRDARPRAETKPFNVACRSAHFPTAARSYWPQCCSNI